MDTSTAIAIFKKRQCSLIGAKMLKFAKKQVIARIKIDGWPGEDRGLAMDGGRLNQTEATGDLSAKPMCNNGRRLIW